MYAEPVELDRPIAWVCEAYHDVSGRVQVRVRRKGMTREEIVEAFPPTQKRVKYNRLALVKAIIWEAHVEGEARPRNNIRGFWYERLMYTLRDVMHDPADQSSIDTTINLAWKELVEGGFLTYDDLNLYSEKENAYNIAVRDDSPYPTALVLVEKEALLDELKDLADVYEISFCAAGGESSRAAAMEYVKRLEQVGIDTSETFTVYSFTDFDPEGWNIPEAFIGHLNTAGVFDVELVRLGVLKEQLGESIVQVVSAYDIGSPGSQKRKLQLTKWQRWAAKTGGIMTPDGRPGRVELNIFTPAQVREQIINGLCQHLDGFAYQVRVLRKSLIDACDGAWKDAADSLHSELDELFEPYYEAVRAKAYEFEAQIAARAQGENQRIAELQGEITLLKGEIERKTRDLSEQMGRLIALDNWLDETLRESFQGAWSEAEAEKSSDALIQEIEENGGWRALAEDLGIDGVIDRAKMIQFAQKHWPVTWIPTRNDDRALRSWAYEEMDISWGDPLCPDETPEALVDRWLNE